MRRLQTSPAGLLGLAETLAILVLRMNEHEESRRQEEEDGRRHPPTCHRFTRKADVLLTNHAAEAIARGINTRDSKGYCGIPRK